MIRTDRTFLGYCYT